MDEYFKELINNDILNIDMLLNIYLVVNSGRIATLLEFANLMQKYTEKEFIDNLKYIIKNINKKIFDSNEKLDIYLERKYPDIRYLIFKQKNLTNILNYLKNNDFEYGLGNILEMSFPGGIFYDFYKPRLIGSIKVNNIDLFVDAFVIIDYYRQQEILKKNLEDKVEKYNNILKNIDYYCEYIIKYDHGVSHRMEQYKKGNILYIKFFIDDYINDFNNNINYSLENI
jgi:hypothetical protein